jgi:DNA repair ATPase RecN
MILVAFALVLAWDALRRFAERNDEFDPDDYEHMHDQVQALESLTQALGRDLATLKAARENQSEHISDLLKRVDDLESMGVKLDDHTQVLANHAAALEKHGNALTSLGLSPRRGPRG